MKKIIVMIPAYNEEKTISKIIKDIPKQINNHFVEVLVINDCSTDNTVEVSKEAGADYIIDNKNNQGLGVNFRKGIEGALKLDADIIVNIDGDGQFNPKDIEKLIIPIIRGEADMVTASRFIRPEMTKDMPLIKKIGNKGFTILISKITGEKFSDTQCGFRAYSREAALRLNLYGKFTYTQEVFIDLISKGMKIKEVPVEVTYNEKRKSFVSGNLRRYGFRSLAIIARSSRDAQPFAFFGLPALALFSIGGIGTLISLIYWLAYHVTTPIKTLLNISIFLVGVGVALGILALLADMLNTLKRNEEQIIYMLKKQNYNGHRDRDSRDTNGILSEIIDNRQIGQKELENIKSPYLRNKFIKEK